MNNKWGSRYARWESLPNDQFTNQRDIIWKWDHRVENGDWAKQYRLFDGPPSKIMDRLYVGDIWSAQELATNGNPLGITAVLDVSTEPAYAKAPGVLYRHVPFGDNAAIPEWKFKECMDFLTEQWLEGKTILIHCQMGISRSVSITASFMHYSRIAYDELRLGNFKRVVKFIQQRRPGANPAWQVLDSCRRWLGIGRPREIKSNRRVFNSIK